MDFISCRRFCQLLLIASLSVGGTSGCRKRKPDPFVVPAKISALLDRNSLEGLPGPVYHAAAKSPIHWQRWSKETFQNAAEAKRLVCVVVAMPQQPSFRQVLTLLDRDPAIVSAMNDTYVPVLVDGDASREIGLLTAQLAIEVKQPLELPFFIWMTHERNPVAWMSVPHDKAGVAKVFFQSNEMVRQMWRDDPPYVLKNSGLDNFSRQERYTVSGKGLAAPDAPAGDARQAARQLVSLYDPFSRNIDDAGGLFPTSILDVMVTSAALPGTPAQQRTRSLEASRELLKDLIPSAMFDPLDGGVFAGRVSPSWTVPSFSWNCQDQARVSSVLLRAFPLIGDPVLQERGLGLIRFAEKKFQLDDGLFAFGVSGGESNEAWLWKVDEIEKALPPEDAKWWIAATGMKSGGNIPSESDPQRTMFRANTLSLARPIEQTAAQLSVPVADFKASFERSRKVLAAIRDERTKEESVPDRTPHAAASLRMISAYAQAFASTGDSAYRQKAVALLAKCRKRFFDGKRFNVYGETGEPSIYEGRAFLYALAMQSARDVADITLDPAPAAWIDELAATVGEVFAKGDFVKEASTEANLANLDIPDFRKVFDDTSVGLFALEDARRPQPKREVDPAFVKLIPPFPAMAATQPILFTDRILASLIKDGSKLVIYGSDLPADLKSAVERLPLHIVPRAAAKDSDGIPAGSVRVISPDGTVKLVSSPSELQRELLPAPQKP